MGAGRQHPPLFLYAINDRKMCSDPISHDGKTFACRRCNQCIATRRNGWVARAMAEGSLHPHSACLTLTYSDDTEAGRQAAKMFCYADVSAFLKRLRSAADYEAEKQGWNVKPYVRFICAGEQGSRNGRCHWHLILYTNFDLARLGEYRLRGKVVSDRREMLTVGKRRRRLNWSLWGFGFMTLQDFDEGSAHYVLSYALKDQFTAEKSVGTMREAKSEDFATGLFRMSKRPAIADEWLNRKLEDWLSRGVCPTSLEFKVPGLSGYWHPSGPQREKLLWSLVALKQRHVWSTGGPPPQWASLLASVSDTDREILNGAEIEEIDGRETVESEISRRQRERAGEIERRDFVKRCASVYPCDSCLDALPPDTLRKIGLCRTDAGYENRSGYLSLETGRSKRTFGLNSYCLGRGGPLARFVFPASSGREPKT